MVLSCYHISIHVEQSQNLNKSKSRFLGDAIMVSEGRRPTKVSATTRRCAVSLPDDMPMTYNAEVPARPTISQSYPHYLFGEPERRDPRMIWRFDLLSSPSARHSIIIVTSLERHRGGR